MIYVVILNFVLAASLLLRKAVLSVSKPIFYQGFRLTGAGIILLAYLYFFHRDQLRFKKADLGLLIQASLFFSYLSYVLAVITLDDLSSARYSFMFNLTPFVTAIIAYFYLNERLTKLEVASLILGFVGFLPLLFVGDHGHIDSESLFSGCGFILFVAVVAYSYGWIVVSELTKKRGYSPFFITGIAFFSGGIAALSTSIFIENWFVESPVNNWFSFTLYIIGIIVMYEIFASNVYAALLKKYSATFLAFAGFLFPIFSALLGWFFLNEGITYNFFISVVIVSCALYLFNKAAKQKNLNKGILR